MLVFPTILAFQTLLGKIFFSENIAKKFGKIFFFQIHKQFPYDFAIPISAQSRPGFGFAQNPGFGLYNDAGRFVQRGRSIVQAPACTKRPVDCTGPGLYKACTRNLRGERIQTAVGQKLELQNHMGIAYEFWKKKFFPNFWAIFPAKKFFPNGFLKVKIGRKN